MTEMSNYEIVARLRALAEEVFDWTDEDNDPDPWMVARVVERLADEICNRNDLAGGTVR